MSRDPTTRFSDRVDDYVRARPSYPPEALETLADRHGLAPGQRVADLGSGTGKLTELLLERGHRVWAVEPNGAMRAAAERLLGGRAGFTSVAGRAEETTLPASFVDWVTAGQAFHWFDGPAARAEMRRILRPPAPVALVWNDRDTEASGLMRDYESILARHGTDYARVNHQKTGEAPVAAFFGDAGYARHVFAYEQVLDRDTLRARLTSSSYTPAAGEPGHEAMLADLDGLFAAHVEDGVVRLVYRTRLYVGRLAAA